MAKDNVIMDKSMAFALRVVRLFHYMGDEKHEFILRKQLLRSGTSIGANVAESCYAQSEPDFISKLSIALKEASETKYWLELIYRSEILEENLYNSIQTDCVELIKLLTASINTVKSKIKKNERNDE